MIFKEIIYWILCIPIALYCLNASHFLLWAYEPYSKFSFFLKPNLLVVIASSVILAMLQKKLSLKILKNRSWQLYVIFIVGIVLIEIIKNGYLIPNKTALLFFAVCLPLIISENDFRRIFMITIFVICSLAFLNWVPSLYWLGFMNLPNTSVERIAGADDLNAHLYLEPVSFGFFGLTEFKVEETNFLPVARLMGWSPEPIHWGYLVMTAVSYSLLLIESHRIKIIACLGIYLLFLGSTAALLVFVYYLICHFLVSKLSKTNKKTILILKYQAILFIILVPGILAPLVISVSREIKNAIYENTIIQEDNNWEDKLEFAQLPNLQSLLFGDNSQKSQSHNFIHQCLINFGLPLWLLFLSFLTLLPGRDAKNRNYTTGAFLLLLINLYQCPSFLLPQSALSIAGLLKIKN